MSEMSKAAGDVLAERKRQIEAEGWTPEHDDAHTEGQLAKAASCYAAAGGLSDDARSLLGRQFPPARWPWDDKWWKPKNRRRDLLRAAALLIAEIERLDRIDAPRRSREDGA